MRRIIRITSGSALVMAGTIMLVTPGPGLLTMAAGLSLLAKDVPAAARLKDRVSIRIDDARQRVMGEGKPEAAPTPETAG
jgi:hypothetical protein